MVRFQEVSINYDIIDPECPNQLNSILQIIDIEGQIPFEVYLNNNPVGSFSQTAFVFDNLSAGNYEFVAIDGNTCSDTINFIIENIDLPNVQIQDISPIQQGDSVGLSADFSGDAEIIQWMPSATLSCDTCLATLAYPTVTQLFSISIIDSQNCIVNDSILVEVVEEKANVYIPNVFSPNGDGINDYFTAYSSSENSSIKEMLIFDRWGELLVERRNIPLNSEIMGWDGNVGNESMDNGVYVYSILIIEDDGTERRYAGDVTLVR
jgi:gliding motility-associated-like protein